MIRLGEYNTLEILRETDPGLYLGDTEENVVLLPHRYKPENFNIGDMLKVFVYLDYEERPVATTLTPHVHLNDFGYLHCSDVNEVWSLYGLGCTETIICPF